ncbi:hypothetical protein BDV09DRAFT_158333 [Aspergillus tetrazonus]
MKNTENLEAYPGGFTWLALAFFGRVMATVVIDPSDSRETRKRSKCGCLRTTAHKSRPLPAKWQWYLPHRESEGNNLWTKV